MLNNDMLIKIMQLETFLSRRKVFRRLFVKNIVRLDVPEKELDTANVLSFHNKKDRAASINILTEHDFISLRFGFSDMAENWRISHYRRGLRSEWYELLYERNVTFSEIKGWFSQCINTPEAGNHFSLRTLLSQIMKHVLIKLGGFFSRCKRKLRKED